MKGIFLIIWPGVFLMICANDELLSKFHQSDYKVKDLFAQKVYMNESYLHLYEIKTFKYNRSTTAFNLTVSAKLESNGEVELLVQAYKRRSNAYRIFPVRFQVNFCKLAHKNVIGLLSLHKHSNLTSCNVKKDVVYHFYNFVIDDSMLPPLIPTGEYKLEATTLYLDDIISITHVTAIIYHA